MKEPKITRYEQPTVLYLRPRDGRNWLTTITAWGETSRSWLAGSAWRPSKYSKAEYTLIPSNDYEDWRWVKDHCYRIGKAVEQCPDVVTLRQIAALVGYHEDGPK
jgi:hypothetical protein